MNKTHIARDSIYRVDGDLTLRLNAEAKEKMLNGEHVINGIIGMLSDEEGHLVTPDFINDIFLENLNDENKTYTSIFGDKIGLENCFKWVCQNYYSSINKKLMHEGIFTPGGTGALSLAIRSYVGYKETVLIPSIGWINYETVCMQAKVNFDYYEMFNENGSFNIKSLINKAEEYLKKEGRILIVLNDPCHNPTGYSLSELEWKLLIKELNKLEEKNIGQITLLLDIAYIDMSSSIDTRFFFKNCEFLNENILSLIAFSASKTLGIYGYRAGALFAISNNENELSDFKIVSKTLARSIWSSPSHHIGSSLKSVFDENNFNTLKSYLSSISFYCEKRYEKICELNKNSKLIFLPYVSGFFLVLKMKNAKDFCEKLRSKNIYLLPLKDEYVRIALCSLKLSDLNELVEAMISVSNF